MVARNSACPCLSGKRFKHCCGTLYSAECGPNVSDEDLTLALMRADDHHLAQRIEPSARSLLNLGMALGEYGIHSVPVGSGGPPIIERARRLNDRLFMPKELMTGGLHLGAYLFRDMFCRLYAPLAMGRTFIDFWKMVDLNDEQKFWIAQDSADLRRFNDQAGDILDFGYGWMEFGHGRSLPPRAKDLIWRAHVQLEAAAATATAAYDFRGTVQCALLGGELALKAGLAGHGISDAELGSRALGHNLAALADRLAQFEPDFDVNRVKRVVAAFPDFVQSRYNTQPPDRIETGHILMGAQYIGSEVTRCFSDRDYRKDNPAAPPRTYPR